MIVLDASIVVHVCIDSEDGDDVLKQIFDQPTALAAPDVISLEFIQVMRRYVRIGRMTLEQSQFAFTSFDRLGLNIYAHATLRDRIWSLRDNLTAYDAAYFALAEQLGAPLWTRDRKFAEIPNHAVEVKIL